MSEVLRKAERCFLPTVNVEISVQYIFLCILHRALAAFDMREKINHNRTNKVKWYVL